YYGIVDLCGFPKERYWTYRAHWRPDDPGRPDAESAGPVAKLELTQERFRDLVFVRVRAVDATGATVTNFNGRLSFKVGGAMELAGVGNGDPMDYDSLQGDSIRAFHGLSLVILRGKDGKLDVNSQELGRHVLAVE
ncbi:MAG: hypothetical protein IJT83_15310, partial [Victivallales bacterium]|nr:hypothetical protein [Victivallales bacterium]